MVAHILAKRVISQLLDCAWLGVCPPFIQSSVMADQASSLWLNENSYSKKKKKKLTTENLLFTRNQIFMWEWFQEWLTCFCSKGLWLGLTSPGLKESRTLNSAYHPQTNGQTEVVNHSLEDFLQSMVGNHLKVLKSEVVLSWICLQPFYESEH
jgi:hypothetical protein